MDDLNFIDINCMIGKLPTPPFGFSRLEELEKIMDSAGISGAVLYHSIAVRYDIYEGNNRISEIAAASPRYIPSWIVVPCAAGETERPDKLLEQLKSRRIKFIRMHPGAHHYELVDWQVGDILEMMNQYRIPLIVPAGETSFQNIYALGKKYPCTPVIITNTSYWHNRELYELAEECGNIYFEISSFLHYNGIEDFSERFGCSRLVFGTNMPFQEPGAALFRVIYSGLEPEGRKAIAGGNLRRLMSSVKF